MVVKPFISPHDHAALHMTRFLPCDGSRECIVQSHMLLVLVPCLYMLGAQYMFPDISGDYMDNMPGADEHQLNTAINFLCSTLHAYL